MRIQIVPGGRGENVVFEQLYSKIEEIYGQVVMLVYCEVDRHIQIQTHKETKHWKYGDYQR